jgi:hypothetical protein
MGKALGRRTRGFNARVFAGGARAGAIGEALEVARNGPVRSGLSVDANAVDLAAQNGPASPSDRPGEEPRHLQACSSRCRAVVSTRKPLFIPAIARSGLEADGIMRS